GVQKGLYYEYLKLFEEQLNKKLDTGKLHIHVVPIPLSRDQMFPALLNGSVDLVAAQVTVTPERLKQVDFTAPTRTNVSELVITAPGTPPIASLDDLSGRQVFVRRKSSYYASLEALNQRLKSAGKAPVDIETVPDSLETDDLLEMVNAGLIPV